MSHAVNSPSSNSPPESLESTIRSRTLSSALPRSPHAVTYSTVGPGMSACAATCPCQREARSSMSNWPAVRPYPCIANALTAGSSSRWSLPPIQASEFLPGTRDLRSA